MAAGGSAGQSFRPVAGGSGGCARQYRGSRDHLCHRFSGGPYLVSRVLRISQDSQLRAERYFNRYGSWALLFSWLPVFGDPLCLASGVLKTAFWRFVLLVALGKSLRYLVVAKLVMQGVNHGLS